MTRHDVVPLALDRDVAFGGLHSSPAGDDAFDVRYDPVGGINGGTQWQDGEETTILGGKPDNGDGFGEGGDLSNIPDNQYYIMLTPSLVIRETAIMSNVYIDIYINNLLIASSPMRFIPSNARGKSQSSFHCFVQMDIALIVLPISLLPLPQHTSLYVCVYIYRP